MKFKKSLKIFICLLLALIVFLNGAEALASEIILSSSVDIEGLELIKYQLSVIKIDQDDIERFGLRELQLRLDMDRAFSFITAANLIEMVGIAGTSLLQLQAYQSYELNLEVASPVLVTSLGNPVYLKLTEEIFQLEQEVIGSGRYSEQFLELNLLPERQDNLGNVFTNLRVKSGEISTVNTSFWSEKEKVKLIGVVNWNRQTIIRRNLSRGEEIKSSFFALYLTHEYVDLTASSKNILTLDDLNRLLWPKLEEKDIFINYIQVFSTPDFDILFKAPRSNIVVNLESNRSLKTISAGFDVLAHEELRLGLRGIKGRRDNLSEIEIGLVISERLYFGNYLEFSGAYYPVIYSLTSNEFTNDHAYWLEMAIKKQPLSARIRYKSSNFEPEEIRILAGLDLIDNLSILLGIRGNRYEGRSYLAGLRINI